MSDIEAMLDSEVVRQVWERAVELSKDAAASVDLRDLTEEFWLLGLESDYRRAHSRATRRVRHMVAGGWCAWVTEDRYRYLTYTERSKVLRLRSVHAHNDPSALEAFIAQYPAANKAA